MRKIKKLELPYDDGKGHFGSGASIIHIIRKVNEMIDLLNQEDWQRKSGTSKIPEGCYEIPLSEVDCIYQSPFSHTPTIKMKQPNELSCMKCGSKENLNSNKDGSFVECDNCMWGEQLEKQGGWRDGDIFNAWDEEGFLKEGFSGAFVLCDFGRYSKLESFAKKHNAPKELLVMGKNVKKSKLLKEKENEEEKTNK